MRSLWKPFPYYRSLPLSSFPKIEIMVEKFQAHNLSGHRPAHEASSSAAPDTKEKWIHVSPKKRGRSTATPPSARPKPGGIRFSEPIPTRMSSPPTDPNPPSSQNKGKAILVENDSDQVVPCLSASPVVHPLREATVSGLPIPFTTVQVPPPFSTHMLVNAGLPEATQSFNPTSPLDTLYFLSHDISSSSHGFVQAMKYDGEENDMYLELDDLNDAMLSTDSSKKRKLEERDECSSHPAN